jgi:hypothetical protein
MLDYETYIATRLYIVKSEDSTFSVYITKN